jgi:hypothetical protein
VNLTGRDIEGNALEDFTAAGKLSVKILDFEEVAHGKPLCAV